MNSWTLFSSSASPSGYFDDATPTVFDKCGEEIESMRLKEALDTSYIKAWVKGRFSSGNPSLRRFDYEVALMETTLYGEAVKMLEKQFPFKH